MMAGFLSSPHAHVALGLTAGLLVVLWDWRFALPCLLLVKLGVCAMLGEVYLVPAPWPSVHFGVLLLSQVILLLSILQTDNVLVDQRGEFSSFVFRSLVLGLAALMVWAAGETVELPAFQNLTLLLLLWLAVLAILTLGLAESALFGAMAISLWLIPMHALAAVIFPVPVLMTLLGVFEIVAALACSYLLLAEEEALAMAGVSATDPGVAEGDRRQLSISIGARILWYRMGHQLHSLFGRLR